MDDLKLKVLIVEDDLSYALELEMLVEDMGCAVVGPVDNAASALEAIYSQRPDIILMDHEIKGNVTGIALGKQIKLLDIPILYITAFGNEANYQDAQQSNMVGYLVKPITGASLHTAVWLAIQNTHLKKEASIKPGNEPVNIFLSQKCLFVKNKGTFQKLEIAAIAYAISSDNYCDIFTVEGKAFLARIPLSKLEAMLPAHEFMRVHRQHIARLDKIDRIDSNEGYIEIGSKKLPITREKRQQLIDMLNTI